MQEDPNKLHVHVYSAITESVHILKLTFYFCMDLNKIAHIALGEYCSLYPAFWAPWLRNFIAQV